MIIVSFVRSNVRGDIGFLRQSNRICVALSRAKHGFYCVGNFEMMAKACPLWQDVVDTLKETNSIGTSIVAGCDCSGFLLHDCKSLRRADLHQKTHCSCLSKVH